MARVSTVGQLGQTIAHEINQPLAAMRMNAEAASQLLAASARPGGGARGSRRHRGGQQAGAGGGRDASAAWSRNRPTERARLGLNQVAAEAMQVMRAAGGVEGRGGPPGSPGGPAAGGRGQGAAAAGGPEPGAQRGGSGEREPDSPRGLVTVRTAREAGGERRAERAGHRAGDRPGNGPAPVRAVLQHQAGGPGPGAFHLPRDCRSARRLSEPGIQPPAGAAFCSPPAGRP
ncbi:MAG: hypothetical protein MZV70_39970 [Desulfobacterales bacterium]|nr:hypothetical protein [Desulfobacterales bacterium]